jgi:hypothetical protein
MMRYMMAGFVGGMVSGCASLEFHEAADATPRGIRVREPVSCVVVKEITRKSGFRQTVETVSTLPLGEVYDINVKQGWFSSTAFSVSLTEQGTVKQVTFDADPQVDETLKAAADVLDSVPILKALRSDEDDPVVSERIVAVRRLELAK